MKQLVIGILAHVDSGKTTLSEALLYHCGKIQKLGRVDHGNAFLDTHDLERNRGITIFSKQAILGLENAEITLLDTPGHVDFSAEMERSLAVLDYAILVINGTDGVQSHTETLWGLLEKQGIPTFLYINKMDLAGSHRGALLSQLKERFNQGCVDFGQGTGEDFWEALALCDEGLFEAFFNKNRLEQEEIIEAIEKRRVFPCFFGSALKLEGSEAFLSALDQYTKAPAYGTGFAAKVFKITRDEQGQRLTHLKVTGGSLRVRTVIGGGESEKVHQIRIYSGEKYTTIDEARAGMVCAVTGLSQTYSGQGLGEEGADNQPLLAPVLTYRIALPKEIDAHTALARLRILEEEDPQLHIVWRENLQEIHMQLMGQVQLEVLSKVIEARFGFTVTFGDEAILYKETIENVVEGVGHFEPLRHYAEVHLLLEPARRGSGIVLHSSCSTDELDKNLQNSIVSHLTEKVHRGVLTGAPLTDVCITLVAGRGHEKHTEGGDFRQATYRALRQGLRRAKSVLLEPWYRFRLALPSEYVGRAMSDFQRMQGSFAPPSVVGEQSILTGRVPVATLGDYTNQLTSYTRGLGRLSFSHDGYDICHNTREVVAQIGYDCDGDVENTADSVFCAHGAGFHVPWDEVETHMHLPSVLRQREEEENIKVRGGRIAAYGASLAEDKELMAIFERTYGPVRRDVRKAFAPTEKAKSVTVSSRPAAPIPAGPEYVLVDGYNIIFDWEELRHLAEKSLEGARSRLINILCNYGAFRRCQVILVFDAHKVKGNIGEVEQVHTISVVYTKEAETADMYIERVTHAMGRNYRVRVATSDGLEQMIILGHGALRISAAAFLEEVLEIEKSIQGFLAK